ncbi:MAG: S16 family serine protease, partial [Lysobacteraceae bacterium]
VVKEVALEGPAPAGKRTKTSVRKSASKAKKSQVQKIDAHTITTRSVTSENLDHFLGVRRFDFGRAEAQNEIGLVTGLAWTEAGGDLLQIEATLVPGKGQMILTGKLGEVMQESVKAAHSVVRARAEALGLDPDFHNKLDFHLHVPEGATPKDGPSAGIAMATALVSALSKVPVRADVAMTGEITLRGRVLPIGGLKEKLLAALRGGVRTVIIPEENRKDLAEIPDGVTKGMRIVPVRWIDEVLDIALERPLTPKSGGQKATAPTPKKSRGRPTPSITH